ncbi:MAG TPA: AAA family ATPase [Longimicrobium sp.]|jgi:predicted ATPase
MEGKRLIHRLKLTDFLSYGSAGVEIDLQPLNVLIGPNASGKSNLLEALGALRAAPVDLAAYFRERGGIGEYIRRGAGSSGVARIQTFVDYPQFLKLGAEQNLRYELAFEQVNYRLELVGEEIGSPRFHVANATTDYPAVYHSGRAGALIAAYDAESGSRRMIEINRQDLKPNQSILAQRKDPVAYPELSHLAASFESIALFQEWNFGRRNLARMGQGADLPVDFLLPDSSNLVLVLHDLVQRRDTRGTVEKYLRHVHEAAERIITKIQGGVVQLYVEERGGEQISAYRLSDGTLRYLSLLAILCHPEPPQLICIEEPELGLHPDILPTIAELLKEASKRTQLIVTTHSDALVSALSDVPESVIVCESGKSGTSLRRLNEEQLATWLEEYSLGDVWRMGEIGGTRW